MKNVKQPRQGCESRTVILASENYTKIYYMAELVQGEKEHSDWFPERSEFCYTDRLNGPLTNCRSLIGVLERLFKRKHFDVK